MFYLLLLLGFITIAAGVFVVGFGIPIRETSFGAALLVAGSVAVTGGLILVGLAAAVRELQRVVQGLKARPGVPRPLRAADRSDAERRDGERTDGRPGPRLPMTGAPGTEAPNVIPTKFDAPDTQQSRKPGPEWLRRAIAEIETAPPSAEAGPASDHNRTEQVRGSPDARPRTTGAPPLDKAAAEERRPPIVSPQNTFDSVWPSEHRNIEKAPEERTEAPRQTEIQPAEVKSPPTTAPAAPPPVAPGPARPTRGEPRPVPVLKSGMIDEMAYTLFTDGSIEAKTPDGTMRFASIEELRKHLEKNEG